MRRRRIVAPARLLLAVALAGTPALAQPADRREPAPRGELTLSPAAPVAGAEVAVTYADSSGAFAGAPTLVLRGVIRRADDYVFEDAPPARRLATLARRADGAYVGTLALPADVAYARLAVERDDGRLVDARGGGGWELLVSDADGRPTFAALHQRTREFFGRSWDRVDEAARQMVALYPDSAGGWLRHLQLQLLIRTGRQRDSLLAEHRAHLAALAIEDGEPVSDAERATRARYASMLGDTTARDRWASRGDASILSLLEVRVGRLLRDSTVTPRGALERLEEWWTVAARGDFVSRRWLADGGLAAAVRADDVDAAVRWAERFEERATLNSVAPLAAFVQISALRRRGIDGLQVLIADLARDSDAYRALDRARGAPVPGAEGLTAYAGTLLVRAQLAEGDSVQARSTLAHVSRSVPFHTSWQEIAPLQLALGDTAAAVATLARLAAHPEVPPAQADSARRRAEEIAGARRLAAALDAARAEQRDRALAGGVRRALPATVRLVTPDSAPTTLRALAGGAPTLVVHWSRGCGFSLQAMPGIARMARRLRAAGVRVLLATTEAPNAELLAYADEQGIREFLVSDTHRDLVRALDATDTPSYYLLDAAGDLRHDRTDLASIATQAAALRNDP